MIFLSYVNFYSLTYLFKDPFHVPSLRSLILLKDDLSSSHPITPFSLNPLQLSIQRSERSGYGTGKVLSDPRSTHVAPTDTQSGPVVSTRMWVGGSRSHFILGRVPKGCVRRSGGFLFGSFHGRRTEHPMTLSF